MSLSAESANERDRLCGCSFIHPQRSLADGLSLAKSFGFHKIDIAVGGGNRHFEPEAVALAPQNFANEVRRELDTAGLEPNECFTLNFGPPLNSPHERDCRRTKELFTGLCKFAELAGFRSLLFIPGPVHEELGQQASLDLSIAACAELVPIAASHNVLLNIEADCDSCAKIPEAAAELCERVPGLGLTLDYSHFIYQGIEAEQVRQLHKYTRHIHIRQAAPGHIVSEVDKGSIDYDTELCLLEKAGYNGLYCIEYLSLDARPETLAASERRTRAMKPEVERILHSLAVPVF